MNYVFSIQMKSKSLLKLPSQLNLGTILPGQYGEIMLPLKTSAIAFIQFQLSSKAVSSGFFLVKEGTNDCKNEMKLVLKPGTVTNIIVASYPEQLTKSTTFSGELIVGEQGNLQTIKLLYKVQIPRILCKMMLENIQTKDRMIRIIINKAVTSEGRIMLTNQENFKLQLKPELLLNNTIADKESPFIVRVDKTVLQVQAKQQFIVFLNLSTNIGFKQDFHGMKKCVLRNVLTLKTNSTLFWCLPVQIIVIFVKEPALKE